MSDTDDLEVPVEEPTKQPAKPKRVMSELQLKNLKLAREKAVEVKRAAKAEKDKVQKELIAKEKAKRLAKMEEKVKKSFLDLDMPEETEDVVELDVETKELPKIPKKPKKPKKKVVVVHDSGSDSDSDTQVIYIPKKKSRPKEPAQPEPAQPQPAPLAFGQMPRFQLNQLNHNRQFYQ